MLQHKMLVKDSQQASKLATCNTPMSFSQIVKLSKAGKLRKYYELSWKTEKHHKPFSKLNLS